MRRLSMMAALAASLVIVPAAGASTAITPKNAAQYGFYISTSSKDGKAEFVPGPASQPETPPLGQGSLRLFTGTEGDKVSGAIYTATADVPVALIKQLNYYAYISKAPADRAPFVIMGIDNNGDTSTLEDAIAYTPGGRNGAVNFQKWTKYDTINLSWFGRGFRGTLQDYVKAQAAAGKPQPKVAFVGIFFGYGQKSSVFDGNIDAFQLQLDNRENTFDFETEPAAAPSTAQPCVVLGVPIVDDILCLLIGPSQTSLSTNQTRTARAFSFPAVAAQFPSLARKIKARYRR